MRLGVQTKQRKTFLFCLGGGSRITASLARIAEEELKLGEEVGEGTFSVVKKAIWTRNNKYNPSIEVAVKTSKSNRPSDSILSEELARDLVVISGLPHPNILTFYGVCEPTNGGPAQMVCELMSGDLAKYIKEAKNKKRPTQQLPTQQLLPTQVLLRVLRDVSSALTHLHAHGVVHRDVKPANVLLREGGEQVRLCDFGSSKDLQSTIQQMTTIGTLDYMAPEVLNKERAGRPADVWSFGVLLFECVTGTPCKPRAGMTELTKELEQAGCLPKLMELFVDCHAQRPDKRPAMAEIYRKLQQLVMKESHSQQLVEEELKRALAQDREMYNQVWRSHYADQPHSQDLLKYVKETALQLSGDGDYACCLR